MCTSRSVGQFGHCLRWEEPGRELLCLERLELFCFLNLTGRSVVVVVSAAGVSVTEDRPGSDAPGRRAARRTDGVSAGK